MIVREESTNVFSVRTFSHQDHGAISQYLAGTRDREYQVYEERHKRIKLTNAIDISRENVVLIASSKVREAFEQ